MFFELDLLENSYDFIRNSIELYTIADEYGTHQEWKSSIDNKIKWKMSFISLVQAIELLFKDVLFQYNPCLVLDNIDSLNEDKTVSVAQAINRVTNLKILTISDEERRFLLNCIRIRNEFIHYRVAIKTEEIKSKYCKLFSLYNNIHQQHKGYGFPCDNGSRISYTIFEIMDFSKNWTIFRGEEMTRKTKQEFEKEIKENNKYNMFISPSGEMVKRIPFGKENDYCKEMGHPELQADVYEVEYCDDCTAKQGEYHYSCCDLEICPMCLGQAISCTCNLEILGQEKAKK